MPSFEVGREYSPRELLLSLGLPDEAGGGGWFRGYHRYGEEFCIFATVRPSGRPDRDRRDHWEGELLCWSAKQGSTLRERTIQELVSGRHRVHVFWRHAEELRFVYCGDAVAKEAADTSPVTVLWSFPAKAA